MTTSAPRPSVSFRTSSTGSTWDESTVASGATIAAAAASRSALTSARKTRAAPRARASRTCRHPIGPAPTTTTSGKRSTASASRRTASLPARVACGIATPSPTYVEIERSRSSIASTYAGSTAPVATSTAPHCLIASSRSAARSASWIAPRSSTALSAEPTTGSAIELTAVLHRIDDPVDRRIADEHLHRHDHGVGCAHPRPVGQPLVADDHVGVGRDGVDRRVLDDDAVLAELLAQHAGEHDAAAHAGVAGDDDLVNLASLDGGHVP